MNGPLSQDGQGFMQAERRKFDWLTLSPAPTYFLQTRQMHIRHLTNLNNCLYHNYINEAPIYFLQMQMQMHTRQFDQTEQTMIICWIRFLFFKLILLSIFRIGEFIISSSLVNK